MRDSGELETQAIVRHYHQYVDYKFTSLVRIWANRQSAARSKERKMRYISDLEQKVKTLEIEAASLSAQLAMVKRDTTDFTAENDKLKVRLQSLEQQVQLQDGGFDQLSLGSIVAAISSLSSLAYWRRESRRRRRVTSTFPSSKTSDFNLFPLLVTAINNALKEEVQHLQVVAGTVSPIGGDMTNNGADFNANQQLYPYNNALRTLITDQQLHQLQIRPPLQPNQVQHQPPNVMRNKGPTPPSQKGPDFNSSSME
ncbi:bZIP transcription factor family protein 11 [Cinnamomum micranthum f. kanehirae]|uniref:BZIP transcription factor family protein 11 n=1 Tax=Cinnamomum micranthum f. kanehirae TaxID=337451 RepID=A0A3S3MWM3_9MAGN|nr:bZIP transcription factor family protein 11 [Cinnamomum micranthum f. kanehirae]